MVKPHLNGTQPDNQLPESVEPILELLDKYQTRATFAVLGIVAERYPDLVRAIFDKGHEIASHGYSHKMLDDLTPEEFEQEIIDSVRLLSSITGERPIGFRAPSFSLNNSTRWALPILEKHGFKYDASVFPIRTHLYGVPKAPLHPYRPSADDITKESHDHGIVEFPNTVLKIGPGIPVAGGFYLRVLPTRFLDFAIRRIEKRRPVMIYIHPWETHCDTPRMKSLPHFSRFVTYWGISKALGKLEHLLSRFRFKPIREVLAENGFL